MQRKRFTDRALSRYCLAAVISYSLKRITAIWAFPVRHENGAGPSEDEAENQADLFPQPEEWEL